MPTQGASGLLIALVADATEGLGSGAVLLGCSRFPSLAGSRALGADDERAAVEDGMGEGVVEGAVSGGVGFDEALARVSGGADEAECASVPSAGPARFESRPTHTAAAAIAMATAATTNGHRPRGCTGGEPPASGDPTSGTS